MNGPEMIDISNFDFNESNGKSLKSSNFGGGIELLMNGKVKEGPNKVSSDIDIDDLTNFFLFK